LDKACNFPLVGCHERQLKLGQGVNHAPQAQTMTLDEKLAISCKAAELRKAGDKEGAMRLMKTAPMPPYLAKVMK